MNAQELRGKTTEELNEQLHKLLREQFQMQMRKVTGQLGQSHLVKQLRRDIARIKTVLNDKAGN